jgi:hypothetical protein
MTPLSPQALIEATDKALDELRVQTIDDIQRSTALTWSGRALAAYQLFEETGDIRWLLEASDYAHEGLEHASLHPDPSVIGLVRPALFAAAERARHHPTFAHLVGYYAA